MKKKDLLKTLLDIGDWWGKNKENISSSTNEYGYGGEIDTDELNFVDEAIFELTGKYRNEIKHTNHWR